jgi:hypothetical protein
MQLPMVEKNEIKIFILYLMDRIGYPLSCGDVCSIMHQENVVSYFDCADCFAELIDGNHVVEVEKNETGEALYIVTRTGKQIATELNDTLSPGIKEASYRSAIRHLSFRKRKAAIDCSYVERPNGKCYVHCEITEDGVKVLDANIEVDSKLEADTMIANFRRRPEIVFRGMLALISGEKNYIFE